MLNEAKGSHGNFETTLDSASNSSLNSQPVLWAGRERGGAEFWFCWRMILLMFGDWIVMEEQEGGLGAREYHRGTHSIYLLSIIAMFCILLYTATGVRSDNLK